MARYLANKCSIASRIDCFAGKIFNLFETNLCNVISSFPLELGTFMLKLILLHHFIQRVVQLHLVRSSVNKLRSALTFTTRGLLQGKTSM